MQIRFYKHILQFEKPVGTSRGVLHEKTSYIVIVRDGDRHGMGECSLLPGLSPDDLEQYHDFLEIIKIDPDLFYRDYLDNGLARLELMPSIRFGLEMAFKDLDSEEDFSYFESLFSLGVKSIPINGLIWMGDKKFIYDQIEAKLKDGWKCIKIKIGNNKFSEEVDVLKYIRSQFSVDDLELRLDANGAFLPSESADKLDLLSQFNIHSIEQPIKQGQWSEMANLCQTAAIDIALDEELIGIYGDQQAELLDTIKPQYIICKPSLLGGWRATEQWVTLAQDRNVGWWATSALESNVGLNAIAQWTSHMDTTMYQGLGTGELYTNNLESPLHTSPGYLNYNPDLKWGKISEWVDASL